jgi:hypothetical protein
MAGLASDFLRDSLFRRQLRTSLPVKAGRRVLPVDGQSTSAVVCETVWSAVHLRSQRRASSSMVREGVEKLDDSCLGYLCTTPV